MQLPSEILTDIFSYLPKSSQKTLRLACQTFYDISTPFLFDSIFVSARYADREVADTVASRFPNPITTLTLSSECYPPARWNSFQKEFQFNLEHNSPKCPNFTLHVKQGKIFQELYCRLATDQDALYESGAVQEQLCRLLNTLPNLRQIHITDRRRRQDLSWLQEAIMGETTRLRKRTTSHRPYKDFWTKAKDGQALAKLKSVQSVGCNCLEVGPHLLDSRCCHGLGDVRYSYMPRNPWTEVMAALHKSSRSSIRTISVRSESRNTDFQLPFAAIADYDPSNPYPSHPFSTNTTLLEGLTTLELRFKNSRIRETELEPPFTVLWTASNLRSLTIDIVDPVRDHLNYGEYNRCPTAFEVLLGGCQLPRLSTLYLSNFTFCESELSTFLRHSPGLRDLSLKEFYMVEEPSVQRFARNPAAYRQCWERLLCSIKETLQWLECFHISNNMGPDAEYLLPGLRPKEHDEMVRRFMFNGGINPFAEAVW